MARVDRDEVDAEFVGKWGVCWGAVEARTEVLFGQVGEVVGDMIKELMSYPKCRSVKVINNPGRPGSNHREVNYINYK
jgi:hypothetical protein